MVWTEEEHRRGKRVSRETKLENHSRPDNLTASQFTLLACEEDGLDIFIASERLEVLIPERN